MSRLRKDVAQVWMRGVVTNLLWYVCPACGRGHDKGLIPLDDVNGYACRHCDAEWKQDVWGGPIRVVRPGRGTP